ncbi:rhodanese-like domain-containing protein [Azomonas macrocytogenes]|uniref:Rhodanese-related sulfurtransferase n=1 Tax=Azomonas macrocytogenes TaxID=69962 RepID=A0A839SZV8_AZOMA|nr:rhodanese-like domain-containing protein [Azomonas macrocytogenes]MBB3101810.1 rhodanese-related sulfurtransferase [Azomonas macrocytogenes]
MSRILIFAVFLIPGWLSAQEIPRRIKDVATVNLFQAKQLYDKGAVFVDIRPTPEWSWGHVHGAVHLDFYDEFGNLEEKRWPRDVPLVIYCDSDLCENGAAAAGLAATWGYRHVYYFRDGYFAWQLADLPQGKGMAGELVSLSAQVR